MNCGAGQVAKTTSESLHYGVNIYPNPTTGVFNVNCVDCTSQPSKAVIYNVNGTVLQTRLSGLDLDLYNEQYDLSGQPAGVYLIKLQYNDSSFKYYKVVKE